MNLMHRKLIGAYTTLVMAGRKALEDVPETEVILDNGIVSTIKAEVTSVITNNEPIIN